MRIVGGMLGGRVLRAPTGAATRPTSEKVREAIFAILPDVAGARVLDLFAGSGALGLEAISRGAGHATFVDTARAPLAAVRANVRSLGLDDRCAIVPGDAVTFAGRAAGSPWNLVFVDPPYASDLALRAVGAMPVSNLSRDAVILIEHDRRNSPPETIGSLLQTDQRRYGDTLVSFYRVPT
jgi:16S rRNA (guanine966-N2)-methyltransferase